MNKLKGYINIRYRDSLFLLIYPILLALLLEVLVQGVDFSTLGNFSSSKKGVQFGPSFNMGNYSIKLFPFGLSVNLERYSRKDAGPTRL